MATTYIRPYKRSKGLTALETLKDRFDYGLNPEKCAVVSSHLCDPATAHLEFMLTKSQYQAETGHLFYQIRQAFPAGELTPEEANRIGRETALRWTKGKYQFFVCTHTDRGHLHNHIYYCSTAYDRSQKFHNFWGSAFAVRRLSDRVCLEHGLSIIENPKQHSKSQFQHYGQWLGGEKEPSFQERLKAQIDLCLAEKPGSFEAFLAPECVNLIIDIQAKLKEGKGLAYERWATIYNLKQMAAALQFLQENNLLEYGQLETYTAGAVDRFHALAGQIQNTEAAMCVNRELKAVLVDYAKTRPVFDGYKVVKYSKKYLAEHGAELALYRSAQAAFKCLLNGGRLPKMDVLKAEGQRLVAEKKSLYGKYRAAQKDMRAAVAVKGNVDHLLGITDGQKNKEMTR